MKRYWAVFFIALALASAAGAETARIDLETAETLALRNSSELKEALAAIELAQRSYRLGIRDFLPKVSLVYSDSASIIMFSPDSRSISFSVNASQPLFDGGRALRGRRLQEYELSLKTRAYELQKDATLDGIRSLFFKYLILESQYRIQSETSELAKKQLAISAVELEIGSIREIEYVEAEIEEASYEAEVAKTERSLKEAAFQLKLALGLPASSEVEFIGDFDGSYAGLSLSGLVPELKRLALAGNADLKQGRLELARLAEESKIQRAWYVPNVALETGLSFQGQSLPLQGLSFSAKLNIQLPSKTFPASGTVSSGGSPGRQRDLGSSANLSLLDSLGALDDIAYSEFKFESAVEKAGKNREGVEFEIERLSSSYALACGDLARQRRLLDLESRKKDILEKQVEIGEAQRIDYIKAMTKLAGTRITVIEKTMELRDMERQIEKTMGADPGTLEALCAAQ
jgi:outer membrane protein TolC